MAGWAASRVKVTNSPRSYDYCFDGSLDPHLRHSACLRDVGYLCRCPLQRYQLCRGHRNDLAGQLIKPRQRHSLSLADIDPQRMGRPPIGKVAMTGAERVRRHRLKKRADQRVTKREAGRKRERALLRMLGWDLRKMTDADIAAAAEAARRISQCDMVPGAGKRRPQAAADYRALFQRTQRHEAATPAGSLDEQRPKRDEKSFCLR